MAGLSHGGEQRGGRIAWRVFLALWLIWGAVLVGIRVQHPGLGIGEEWGDADIISAGRWFDAHGLRATGFLPRLETGDAPAGEELKTYNTFPPGPFWIHQGLKAAGVKTLAGWRAACQVWTHLGVLALFFVASRLSGSRWIGLFACVLYMFSVPYAAYASGFWVNMGQPTLFGTMACWLMMEKAETRRRRVLWLGLATAVCFVDFWITLENAVVLGLFVGVRAMLGAWRVPARVDAPFRGVGSEPQMAEPPAGAEIRRGFAHGWAWLAAGMVVGVMPAVVMVIRVLHNAEARGLSFVASLRSFKGAAEARSGADAGAKSWGEVGSVWLTRLGWPRADGPLRVHNSVFVYPVLSWVVIGAAAGLLVMVLVRRSPGMREARRGLLAGALLVGAGLTWTVLMRMHVWHHRFTVLTIMPWISLVLGSLAAAGLGLVGVADAGRSRCWCRWLGTGAALLLLGGMISALRFSDTLNLVAPLDQARYRRVQTVQREYRDFAAAGRTVGRNFDRIAMMPKRPMITCQMGVPFVNSMELPPAEVPPAPGQAWVIDTWDPRLAPGVAGLAMKFGPPDVLATPGRLVVFPAKGRGAMDIRLVIEELGELRAVRLWPALNRGQVALVWVVAGKFDRQKAERFVLGADVLAADGRAVEKLQTRIAWTGTWSEQGALAWASLPRAAWKDAATLRLSVWDADAKRPAGWQVAMDLPEGVHMTADRKGLELDLRMCAPWLFQKSPAEEPAPAEQPRGAPVEAPVGVGG